ncbi:MAG: hypothetical protein HRT61_12180, partial [Ekhidna sp.]|nr:hypothetical protein [Ekhidna sp.]
MRNSLLLCFISLSSISYAQFNEGVKVIDLSFSSSFTDGNDQVFVQPIVGFSASENSVFFVGFGHSYQKSDPDIKVNNSSIIVGYERFFELNERIYFATFYAGSYGFGKFEFDGGETDLRNLALTFRPRFHYFINNKWSLVASVGSVIFSRQTVDDSFGENTTNIFSAELNSSNVLFGVR